MCNTEFQVMSKSKIGDVSSEHHRVEPDYFGYYKHQVAELLAQDEDFPSFFSRPKVGEVRRKPFPSKTCGTTFSNGIENGLSDFKRERLHALLRQGGKVLSAEVDEMLDPVLKIRQLKMQLKKRAASDDDAGQAPSKKLKVSSPSSTNHPQLARQADPGSEVVQNDKFYPDRKVDKSTNDLDESEVNVDLQLLLESDSLLVEETANMLSGELTATLGHMEEQLEELLDILMSKCRSMTLLERMELKEKIKALPPQNLERVAEIVSRNKQAETRSHDEIQVDLAKEDNATLWWLHYYVEAVEKARKSVDHS